LDLSTYQMNTNIVITATYLTDVISKLIIVWVCCTVFSDDLSRSKRRVFIETGIIILIYIFIGYAVHNIIISRLSLGNLEHSNMIGSIGIYSLFILFYSSLFFYFYKTVSSGFYKLFFVFCLVVNFTLIPSHFYSYTHNIFANLNDWFRPEYPYTLSFFRTAVSLLTCIIMFFPINSFFKRYVLPFIQTAERNDVKKVCFIPILFIVIFYSFIVNC